MTLRLLALALALPLLACGEHDPGEHSDHDHDHSTPPTAQRVTIRFALTVGAEPFACDKTFTGLGRAGTTWTPRDAKLYIHDVKLVNSAGQAIPVTIRAEGAWQADGVALLDFEDGAGTCVGDAATRTTIQGEVPIGEYEGISFKLGVPPALNHRELARGPSPLAAASMFSSRQAGYRFMRMDGATTNMPMGAPFHLLSTGCRVGEGDAITCSRPNRPAIALSDFTPDKTIVLDLKELFAGAHLDLDEGGSPGCLSDTNDPDCAPIFRNLGLPFGGPAHTAPRAFRLAP